MSLRIRQIVVAARDLEATVGQFTRVLGVRECYRDPGVAKFGLENALLLIGDQFLEVVSPMQADTAAGRHLARHGDSGYMLILQTDDLARERARFNELGVRIVYEAQRPGIEALHLHPKDIGGAIVSLDEANPPEGWPWAGSQWQDYASPQGAQRVVGATIGAVDPTAMAKRWAQVLGTKPPEDRRIGIEQGELLFQSAPSNVLTGFSVTIAGPEASLARASDEGFPVEDDTVVICGTRFRLLA